MKIKRIVSLFLALVLALSAVAVLGSCKKSEKGITVQIGPNPETLDPALNNAVDGGNMLITLFETLLIIDQDNKVQPGQAESYTVSPDGLTWTFTMRDGLKWSDGTELNAKDFEYAMKRIANPDVGAPYGETVVGMIEGYQDAIGNPDKDGKKTTKPDIDKLNVKASEDGKTLTIKPGHADDGLAAQALAVQPALAGYDQVRVRRQTGEIRRIQQHLHPRPQPGVHPRPFPCRRACGGYIPADSRFWSESPCRPRETPYRHAGWHPGPRARG